MSRYAQITARSLRAAAFRTATLALMVLAILGILGAVVVSPLVLSRVPTGAGTDWSKLSDVGQTYGAASALFSVLALGGVAVSLHLQRRESKAAREQALRGLHTDLLRMALDDVTFLECWGPIGDSTDISWYRQHIYLNLIVSHWQMMWEIGSINERHLRLTAAGLFGGPLGLRYWSEAREARRVAEMGRRARIFHSIIEGEYHEALRRPSGRASPNTATIDLHAAAEPRLDRPGASPLHASGSVGARSDDTPVTVALPHDRSSPSGLETAMWLVTGAVVGAAAARLFSRCNVLLRSVASGRRL